MDNRRKITACGRQYRGTEVLYRHRREISGKKMVCVACYVTLPMSYHVVAAAYERFNIFCAAPATKIIYSFLLIPVASESESRAVLADMAPGTMIAVEK